MRTVRLATETRQAFWPYMRPISAIAVTFETEIPSLDAPLSHGLYHRRLSLSGGGRGRLHRRFAYAHRLGAPPMRGTPSCPSTSPGCTSEDGACCSGRSSTFWLQGVRNAYSLIRVPNRKLTALHELGFTLMGVQKEAGYKLGAWHDVAWLRMAIGDFSAAPEPRMPLSSGSTRWPGAGCSRGQLWRASIERASGLAATPGGWRGGVPGICLEAVWGRLCRDHGAADTRYTGFRKTERLKAGNVHGSKDGAGAGRAGEPFRL